MKGSPDTALIVLDMFNLFDFEGGRRLGRAAQAIAPRIAQLRARFDRGKAPVIYVNDNFANWQGEFSDLVGSCLDAGGPPASIAGNLAPRPRDFHVLKPKHSAFLGTPLAILLPQLGVRRLVLTGVAADACVVATAQDANMREFPLWIPRDCVAAITEVRTRNALSLLASSMHANVQASPAVHGLFPKAT